MTEQFSRIPRSSASADATRVIKEMILSGRLKAGEKLPTEHELAESLGISRPTVRESLRALVALHILKSVHGRGTYVASLNTEDLMQPLDFVLSMAWGALQELFDARLVLEPAIAALAAERVTDAEIMELRLCIEQTHVASHSPDDFLDLDIRLHRLIAQASHNNLLLGLITSLNSLGVESRAMTVQLPGLPEQTAHDHADIVEAIASRRPELAREMMAKHIANVASAAAKTAKTAKRSTPRTETPARPRRKPDAEGVPAKANSR